MYASSLPLRPYKREYVEANSTFVQPYSFADRNLDAQTPSSIRYRIDDLTNDREILDWTAIGSPAARGEITVTSAQNAPYTDYTDEELRQITVEGTVGGAPYLRTYYYVLFRILRAA